MSNRIAVFPGTFDPFTNGHLDIVLKALKLFDVVIIAIGHNANKKHLFFGGEEDGMDRGDICQ